MDYSTSGFTVLYYLQIFAHTHVHWVDNAIQPSHPVAPISSCSQSFSASMSFPMSWLFTWDSQSIGASTLASVLPMNIQGWFPLALTGLMSLQPKGLFKSLLQHHSSKASIPQCSAFFMVQLSYLYMEKPWFWWYIPLSAKWYLCFWIYCLGRSYLSFQGASIV